MKQAHQGFTLLEVLVALMVIGIGLGAALRLTHASENALWQREQRMVAGWVAHNRLNALRLGDAGAKDSGVVRMAGREWRWRLRYEATDRAGLRRLHIIVTDLERPAAIVIELESLL